MSVNPRNVKDSIATRRNKETQRTLPSLVEGKNLKVGMQVLKFKPGKGYAPDIKLTSYFPTSSRVPTASFRTDQGTLVIFANCAMVPVAS